MGRTSYFFTRAIFQLYPGENKLLFHVSNFSAISWGEQVTFSCEQFFSYIIGGEQVTFSREQFSAISRGEQIMFSREQFFSYIMGRTSYFFM
jgi:hypothetical protein